MTVPERTQGALTIAGCRAPTTMASAEATQLSGRERSSGTAWCVSVCTSQPAISRNSSSAASTHFGRPMSMTHGRGACRRAGRTRYDRRTFSQAKTIAGEMKEESGSGDDAETGCDSFRKRIVLASTKPSMS
eukprot:scaffold3202_cov117-Isochrysis_galbana.AAC.8